MAEAAVLEQVGRRLRALREQAHLSLRDLSEQTGFSPSFLSQVERGSSSASISSLAIIAEVLKTSLSELFAAPTPTTLVVRVQERQPFRLSDSPVTYVRLAAPLAQRVMEPLIVTLPPHFASQEPKFVHKGEEFGLVLSGILSMIVEQRTYELVLGDTIHFRADVPHTWANHQDEPTVLLWVTTPSIL